MIENDMFSHNVVLLEASKMVDKYFDQNGNYIDPCRFRYSKPIDIIDPNRSKTYRIYDIQKRIPDHTFIRDCKFRF